MNMCLMDFTCRDQHNGLHAVRSAHLAIPLYRRERGSSVMPDLDWEYFEPLNNFDFSLFLAVRFKSESIFLSPFLFEFRNKVRGDILLKAK